MKGISPLVATVLLIAFTITIAAMVAAFSRTFVGEQTEEALTRGQEITAECQFARIFIDAASYDGSETTLSTLVRNVGTEDLSNFKMRVFYSATNFTTHTPDNSNATLSEGDIEAFSASDVSVLPERVEVFSETCPLEAVDSCRHRAGEFLC